MRYPELPMYRSMSTEELTDLYDTVKVWSSQLLQELDTRDVEEGTKPATIIQTLATTTDFVGIPLGGNLIYAAETGTYYGWDAVTSVWDALN